MIIVCFALFLSGCTTQSGKETPEKGKPNIVLILADDQTYESIRALGNQDIKTPNLDRLVRNGTTFTHAYNMGGWSGAICVASRSMLLSGRYLWRAEKETERWASGDTAAFNRTWPKLMEQAGYETYMTGKWHVGVPAEQVFQHVRHVRGGMPPDAWGKGGGREVAEAIRNGGDAAATMPVGYNRPLSPDDHSWDPTDTTFGGYWQGGKHWSEVLKDDALEYIDAAAGRESPFFMYLAFNAPHDPRQSPREYLDKYPVENIPVPDNFLPEYPYKDAMGAGPGLRDEALAPFPRTEYAVKKHRQEYYALITHLDAQIGKILDALEASGQMNNTYVFFTADHGLAVGHHGLIGKQNMYDHSVRVPFIVAGPGIPKDAKRDQTVYLQDVMATALDLAGIEKPAYVEFESLMDLIRDPGRESHLEYVYGAYTGTQRMITKGDYKLIVYPKINKVRLYNLKDDPQEMRDLAGKPEYEEQVTALSEELRALQREMDDKLALQE